MASEDCPCIYYDEASRSDDGVIGVCECGHNDDEHDDQGACEAAWFDLARSLDGEQTTEGE